MRCGPALHFPKVERPSAALAKAVTDRIWPCVELQWEWLGGTPPLRRVAVIGAGSWGTSLAIALARAGTQVELGCRTEEQARELSAERENRRYLPGVRLPDTIRVARAGTLELREADLVCLAVPTRDLPVAMGEIGDRLGARTSLLVSSKGLVPPAGELPSVFCSGRAGGRTVACLGGPAHAADAVEHGASLVLASTDPELLAQLRRLCADAGFDVETTSDVVGVELAGVAKNAAVLAATTASIGGPNAVRRRRRQGLLRDRRLRRRARAHGPRPGPASPAPATSSPRSSRPEGATAAPASCSRAASPSRRSAPRSGRSPRRWTRCRCS